MTRGKVIQRWSPFCLAAFVVVSGCEGSPAAHSDVTHHKNQKVAAAHAKPARRADAPGTEMVAQARTVEARAVQSDGVPYVGLAESQLVARLGQPSARREDQPPGKTWRYQNKTCAVDFMLYPDVETRVYRALAYEVINDDKSAAGKRLCLAELEARAHGR